jgi:hypothetical protein
MTIALTFVTPPRQEHGKFISGNHLTNPHRTSRGLARRINTQRMLNELLLLKLNNRYRINCGMKLSWRRTRIWSISSDSYAILPSSLEILNSTGRSARHCCSCPNPHPTKRHLALAIDTLPPQFANLFVLPHLSFINLPFVFRTIPTERDTVMAECEQ